MTLSGLIRVRGQFLAQEAVLELGCPAGVDGVEPAGSRQMAKIDQKWPTNSKFWHDPKLPRKPKFGKFEGV